MRFIFLTFKVIKPIISAVYFLYPVAVIDTDVYKSVFCNIGPVDI